MILFNRYKHTQVERVAKDKVKINSAMCDSFHEINVTLVVGLLDNSVKEAEIEFLRQPDIICKETANLAGNLIGLKLGPGLSKEVKERVSGPSGCTHVGDLVLEAAKAYVQGKFRIEFEEIGDREEARKDLDNKLAGTCWYHTRHMR